MIILRTDKGDFDLFGDSAIVQSFSIFNFENLTARNGEYTNLFDMPKTSNNLKILEYADYINSINTTPYQKIDTDLIVNNLYFKNGFLVIEEVSDRIKARFISGNSNFYNLIKSVNINELDWSAYNHTWNYTNAVANSFTTTGYIYPLIDYNGQTLSGNIVDVRKILPATYWTTILEKIMSSFGYSWAYNFDTTEMDNTLIPYTNRNPTIAAETLLLNSLDVVRTDNYSIQSYTQSPQTILGTLTINGTKFSPIQFTGIGTAGSSTLWDFSNNKFTPQYSGVYSFSATVELIDYSLALSTVFSNSNVVFYNFLCNIYIRIQKKRTDGTIVVLKDELIGTNTAGYNNTSSPVGSISAYTTTIVATTTSVSANVEVGEEVQIGVYTSIKCETVANGLQPTTSFVTMTPTVKNNVNFVADLNSELVFGGLITYSSILPKIKASDIFRETCLRWGLIPTINENDKSITFNLFDTVINNIPNAVNWSDKLDDKESPTIAFKYDSYAQNNIFKHLEDKTIVAEFNIGNYNLLINNANLELEKTIYTSVFAQTENTDFNGYTTAKIDLYDTAKSKFNNDVKPRVCYAKRVLSVFKFTDGTTTSAVINVRRVFFHDDTLPTNSCAFGYLIPTKSALIINVLQNLKLVKVNLNLNLIDILNLDYLKPVEIDKYDAYFFISNLNQYSYNEKKLTNVELIKINF